MSYATQVRRLRALARAHEAAGDLAGAARVREAIACLRESRGMKGRRNGLATPPGAR